MGEVRSLSRMQRRSRIRRVLTIAALLPFFLLSCSSNARRQRAIGEAYVGPASLNLRRELTTRAEVSATVRHGERLEILERRRRFAKVRTESGLEGWTDGRMLLGTDQMAHLRQVAEDSARLPSQGEATPYDLLNVHTEPNRQAPSFYQIAENEPVEVIGQKVTPRIPYDPGNPDGYDTKALRETTELDDWHLARLKDGRAGWVLARMLIFSVPDEVAQYAEGARITAYFSLGSVRDREQEKHHWLWATVASRYQPYHFDSIRVFVWNRFKHRYETSYIERGLKGYYPVTVNQPTSADPEALPGFSIVTETDGRMIRKSYEFRGLRPKLTRKEPWAPSGAEPEGVASAANNPPPVAPPPRSFLDQIRSRWDQWRGRP